MNQFAEYIRKHYPTIILVSVGLGLFLGLFTSAPGKALQRYSQVLTFLMILFISLTITPRQFLLVSKQPGAVLAGMALNFIFMPLVCWELARVLAGDSDLATGIILVGVVPCAGMAAVWTALLKGDVPLGMAINALTMLLAPFLIPPLMSLLASGGVQVNPWVMFQKLTIILLIPLLLGVALRSLADRFWQPYLPVLPALSALTAVLLMFATCNVNIPLILARWVIVPALLLPVALIFPIGFLVPHWLGRYAFGYEQRIAVTFSSGMKNLPIAVGLALSSYKTHPLVGLPVALAFIWQMLTAGMFYRFLRKS